jgi:hypothetical protein
VVGGGLEEHGAGRCVGGGRTAAQTEATGNRVGLHGGSTIFPPQAWQMHCKGSAVVWVRCRADMAPAMWNAEGTNGAQKPF